MQKIFLDASIFQIKSAHISLFILKIAYAECNLIPLKRIKKSVFKCVIQGPKVIWDKIGIMAWMWKE